MKKWLTAFLRAALQRLTPKPDPIPALREEIRTLRNIVSDQVAPVAAEAQRRYLAMLGDLAEAVQMAGSGPWRVASGVVRESEHIVKEAAKKLGLKEMSDGAIGAYGDINLMLANVGWRREIQLGWLEFSRWGIQQIILICRLYYIKNPIVRRLIDVCAAYVFARGVEVTTNDEAANDVLKRCWERNKATLGQIALVESEKRKDYDGNLFWCFFADRANKGEVDIRLIDATEMQEIICNPEDKDDQWYYLRQWTQVNFDAATGIQNIDMQAWYPRLYFAPTSKPDKIRGIDVMWDYPVHHRKCGYVGQWLFGCPRIFPMVDWAREARLLLEACASIKQSLMQIAMVFTTKGGQQAMEGFKQQMGTTVGPATSLWDQNPPAVPGATVAMGTGSELKAFDSSKGGGNPDDVRQYKLMCCMVQGVPETFLADVSTGNLATATTLDRPTETVMLAKQEEWVEDLTIIAQYILEVSAGAPSGLLREAKGAEASAEDIKIEVNFPAIREGDLKELVSATVEAITLNSKGGQAVGIDAKAGVLKLYDLLGIEDGVEMAEKQYPEGKYDPDRTEQEIAPPVEPLQAPDGGQPQIDPQTGEPTAPPKQAESLRDLAGRPTLRRAIERLHEATASK